MRTIYIYKLIDPITNNVRYVGKTTNLVRRLNAHINRSKKNKYHSARWVNSLLEKGLKPEISIIEECNENNWEEREIYWISYYREHFDLTNILDGGGHSPSYGRLGKPWSDEQRMNNRKARLGMKVKHTDEGNNKRADGIRKYYANNKVPVFQYMLNGDFIKKWDSAVDAGTELGIKPSNIIKVCKNERKKSGNFIWSFEKKSIDEYERTFFTKQIIQKDANDVILNEFNSLKEASENTKTSRTGISNCLKGLSKSSGGFKWEYKNNIN